MTQSKSYYVEEKDIEAIATIRKRFGLSTDNDAVRLAFRLLAEAEGVKFLISPRKLKQVTR